MTPTLRALRALSFLTLMFSSAACAQIGGLGTFEFLRLPTNARLVALGGQNLTSSEDDPALFFQNPSILSDTLSGKFSLSYYDYYADIGHTSLAYARTLDKVGTFAVGLQHLGYGSFEGYDATGAPTGSFTAADWAFTVGYAKASGPFRLGANAKFVNSRIDSYSASGMLFDFSGMFVHPKMDFRVAMAVQNVGFGLGEYAPGQTFSMPLDVQVGSTVRPPGMPVRFSLTMHQLHRFLDATYDDPATRVSVDAFGNESEDEVGFGDRLSRHFTLGAEFLFSENFQLRAGYNFLRRRELLVEERPGLAGLSFGAMIRLAKIEFSYSYAQYHIAGGTNNFTLALDTDRFFRKKKRVD